MKKIKVLSIALMAMFVLANNPVMATAAGNPAIAMSESSATGENWDQVLNEYEKYVDKYISLVKKAANGDLTALAEYPSLMSQAEKLSKKLSKAKGSLTTAQWNRYQKILQKMTKAASSL